MSATQVYDSSDAAKSTNTLAAAGDYLPITLQQVGPAGPDGAAAFGFAGTFTSAVVAFEGRMSAAGNWHPLRAVNDVTGAPVAAATVALTNSTAHRFLVPNVAGLHSVRAKLSSIGSGSVTPEGAAVPASLVPPQGAAPYFNGTTFSGATLAGTTTASGTVKHTGTPPVVNTTPATITTAGAGTYTAANLLTGLILRDPNGSGRTDTTATAAQIVAAAAAAAADDVFDLMIVNTADAAETITLAGGTGVTLVPATITIAQNEVFVGKVRITNATGSSEAVTIYGGNVAG